MSSRIEKGGARFKPSIVPRRSIGAATTANDASQSSATTQQTQSQQQSTSAASTGPPPSPSLQPQLSNRQARPPSVRRNVPVQPGATSSAQPLTTPATTQSYAFAASPSLISKPGSTAIAPTGVATPQASGSKPVFRKPSVSKPRPGSRASLTPAPHGSQPTPSYVPPAVQPVVEEQLDEAPASGSSARTHAPPSIRGSRSNRNTNPSSIRAGAGRGTAATSEAPQQPTIDKASQPDPFQPPQPPTRSKVAPVSATVKESASQQDAQSSVRPQRKAAIQAEATLDPLGPPGASAANKGKARTAEPTDASHFVKPASQALAENVEEETEEQKAARAAGRRLQAAARLQKRRLKRKEQATGKPRRPLSAYLLFVNSVRPDRQSQNPDMTLTQLTSEIAAEWRDMDPSQRTKWEADASLLRQQYDSDLEAWKLAHPEGVTLGPEDESDMETTSEIGEDGEPVRRKKRRMITRKPHTVSDDEEEYRKQLFEQGAQLTASKIDPANVTMADISLVEYKKGRAGPRTFEAERVYKRLVNDRRAAAKSALLGDHVLGDKVDGASPSPAPPAAPRVVRTANGVPVEVSEEGIVGNRTGDDDGSGVEESAPETDAEGTTDGEGGSSRRRNKREPSVAATDISFRENRFAVQTRIVDGKIVLDETSLFANYGNGEEDRDNMEVVDEREGDRFVNASTYSRKLGRNRKWTADETAKFYRSLQQWGTDFEMISRLFPGRDRVMIKKKFNIEERSNAKLVDEALKNTVPVNLEAYAEAIGVDLSGPPPEIKADLQDIASLSAPVPAPEGGVAVKKREASAPVSGKGKERSDVEDGGDGDDGWEYEEVVEIDDDGNEQVIRRRIGKKPGAKGRKRRNSTRKTSISTPAPPADIGGSGSAAEAAKAGAGGSEAEGRGRGRTGGPPAIGSRKSTRSKRHRSRV